MERNIDCSHKRQRKGKARRKEEDIHRDQRLYAITVHTYRCTKCNKASQ